MAADATIDYYAILEVPPTASTAQIQTSFRAKARQFHPDKNPGKDTTAVFQQLLKAFETLRDPDLRRQYDRAWRWRSGTSGQKYHAHHESNSSDPKPHHRASSSTKPAENKPPVTNPTRERLNRKLAQLLEREKDLKRKRPQAATRLEEEFSKRSSIAQDQPILPEGPWYTMRRPQKKQRNVFAQQMKDWTTRADTADAAVHQAKDELQIIDDELQVLERDIENVRIELSIEAFVDGASTFAAGLFPFAQTAYQTVTSNVTPSGLAAGVLLGAAALVSTMAWGYTSGRSNQRSDPN